MRIDNTVGNIHITLSTDRFDNNFREAQKLLNLQVVADSDSYIPFQQGALRGSVRYPDGVYGEFIEYDTPYAHYQYKGELYLSASGSSWARKYEQKFPSGKPLSYRTPGTGSQWFESAKQNYGDNWVRLVKRTAGKG